MRIRKALWLSLNLGFSLSHLQIPGTQKCNVWIGQGYRRSREHVDLWVRWASQSRAVFSLGRSRVPLLFFVCLWSSRPATFIFCFIGCRSQGFLSKLCWSAHSKGPSISKSKSTCIRFELWTLQWRDPAKSRSHFASCLQPRWEPLTSYSTPGLRKSHRRESRALTSWTLTKTAGRIPRSQTRLTWFLLKSESRSWAWAVWEGCV